MSDLIGLLQLSYAKDPLKHAVTVPVSRKLWNICCRFDMHGKE